MGCFKAEFLPRNKISLSFRNPTLADKFSEVCHENVPGIEGTRLACDDAVGRSGTDANGGRERVRRIHRNNNQDQNRNQTK